MIFNNILKVWPQALAVITVTLCNISDGMHYGWTSPIFPILKRNDSHIEITSADELWLENIYMAGILAGLGITAWLIILFGTKFTIIFGAISHLVAWLIIGFTSNKILLYVARFLAGIGGNVAFVSIPMYIGEISDKSLRGFFGTFVFTNSLLGLVIIYSVGPYVTIQLSSIVGAFISALQIVAFSFMPESPYNHIIKGKKEKALKSLKWFRNSENVTVEFDEITKSIARQQSEKGRFQDIICIESNRKAFIILVTLNFAQHFSGISVLLMNIHAILLDASSIVPPDKAGIVISTIMFLSSLTASLLIDKYGRKILLVISSTFTAISLTILGTYFLFKHLQYEIDSVNWIPFASVLLYSASFKSGLGLVPIVLIGELFPTNVKAKGMTISDVTYALFGILSVYVYMYLSNNFGIYIPFILFSICSYAVIIFIIYYVPETKGKTLEEIQMVLKGQFNA